MEETLSNSGQYHSDTINQTKTREKQGKRKGGSRCRAAAFVPVTWEAEAGRVLEPTESETNLDNITGTLSQTKREQDREEVKGGEGKGREKIQYVLYTQIQKSSNF